jgi:hypothetical protein
MPEKPKPAHALETEWVHEYARTYLPSDAAFRYSPALLRRERVSLVDIRNALRSGAVIYSDKLDDPGALWIVEGDDADGRRIIVMLHVISESVSVSLQSVEVVGSQKGGSDDAA